MTQSQTTQNTSTSVFGSFMAKTKPVASPEVKEEKDKLPLSFSEIMKKASLKENQGAILGEGHVVTDPVTGDFFINPVNINPYISIRQDPAIKNALKDEKGIEDLKNNLTGYAVMMDTGRFSNVLPFPEDVKTIEEKIRWLDQNNARQIFFDNSTSREDKNKFHTINFTKIMESYYATKREDIDVTRTPQMRKQTIENMPDANPEDIVAVYPRVKKMIDFARDSLGITDERKLAALAKSQYTGEQFMRYKLLGGVQNTAQFLGQAILFGIGEVSDLKYAGSPVFKGHAIGTGEGRAAFAARFMPTLADSFRKNMLARGIVFSQEEAEGIMSFAPSLSSRVTKLATETIPITGPMLGAGLFARAKEGARFRQFINESKGAYKSDGDAAEAYIHMQANKQWALGTVKNKLGQIILGQDRSMRWRRDRLVGAFQLEESLLPVNQRAIIKKKQAYLEKLLNMRDGTIIKKGKSSTTTTPLGKPANVLLKDWVNHPKYADLSRQIRNASWDINYAKVWSTLPAYAREIIKPESSMVLTMAAAGQWYQYLEKDPNTGELIGIGLSLMDHLVPEKWSPSAVLAATSVKTGIVLTRGFERILGFQKGRFAKAKPEGMTEDIARQVEEMAGNFSKLAPDIQAQVLERVEIFFKTRDTLIEAGVDAKVLETSLAKVTGLAMLNVVEQQIKSQVDLADADNLIKSGEFQELLQAKERLHTELSNLAASLIPQLKGKGGPVISEFLGGLRKGIIESQKATEAIRKDLKVLVPLLRSEAIGDLAALPTVSEDALNTAIENIYNLTELTIIKPDIKSLNAGIDKTAVLINDGIFNKIRDLQATAPITNRKQIAAQHSVLAEAHRIKKERLVKAQYTALDTKYADVTADGSSLFAMVMDHITDPTKSAASLNDKIISEPHAKSLMKVFNEPALKILEKHFGGLDSPAFKQLLETMPQGSQKGPAFVLNFLRKQGITFDMRITGTEVFDLTQGLKRKANALYLKGSPQAEQYGIFGDTAETLMDKFQRRTPEGIYVDITDDVRGEFKAVSTYYAEEYATMVLHKKSFGENNLSYTDKTVVTDPYDKNLVKVKAENVDNPSGKVWKNPPENWIPIEKIASSDKEASIFSKMESDFWGEKKIVGEQLTPEVTQANIKDVKRIIDPNAPHTKNLIEIYKSNTIQWITEKVAKGVPIDSPEMKLKMQNLREAFNGLYNPLDEFEDATGYFGTVAMKRRNAGYNQHFQNGEDAIGLLIEKAVEPAEAYVKKLEQDVTVMKIIAGDASKGEVRTATDVFNYFMAAGADVSLEGNTSRLDDLRDVVVRQGKLSGDEFDNALRHIVSQHIGDTVFKDTGKIEFFGYSRPKGRGRSGEAGKRSVLQAKIFDTDFRALETMLTSNPQQVASLKKILGEQHYDRLLNISRYMALQAEDKVAAGMTGIPRGLSIESWISRVYAINRNVISKKYVATEAAIQSLRMRNFNILSEIINNPEAGRLFGEIILSGKPLDDASALRMAQLIATGVARADARTRGATTKSLVDYGKMGAQMAGLGLLKVGEQVAKIPDVIWGTTAKGLPEVVEK